MLLLLQRVGLNRHDRVRVRKRFRGSGQTWIVRVNIELFPARRTARWVRYCRHQPGWGNINVLPGNIALFSARESHLAVAERGADQSEKGIFWKLEISAASLLWSIFVKGGLFGRHRVIFSNLGSVRRARSRAATCQQMNQQDHCDDMGRVEFYYPVDRFKAVPGYSFHYLSKRDKGCSRILSAGVQQKVNQG